MPEPGCPECDEELVQTKPLAEQISPLLQRQVEEEEEELQTKSSDSQISPLIQRQAEVEEEEEEPLQTKGERNTTAGVSPDLAADIHALKGGGHPLPDSERAFFEPRFGTDFSGVRIHEGTKAADLTGAVSAKAFTVGKDVVIGAGQYTPETLEGRKLLGHELTHVVQQTGGQSLASTGKNSANALFNSQGSCTSVDSHMQHGKPQNVVQKKASAGEQATVGTSGGVIGEEPELAQNTIQRCQPMIQCAATWKNGPVHETVNEAATIINGTPTPVTRPVLNGTKLISLAAAAGAIKSPTVSTSKSGATWKAKVTVVPTNTGSFDETVLAKGPWNLVAPKATVGAKLGLAMCAGKGNTTFRAKGDPDDNSVFTANRGHEDKHASDQKVAFNATIVSWDTKVTNAKNKGTEFTGANAADATANLWAAMGGTPAQAGRSFRADCTTRGNAFHATPRGGPMTVASPKADKTCTTSSAKVKNPFK